MGRGSYTASDWAKLRTTRKLSGGQAVENIFTNRQADKYYDSKKVQCRFCCDPAESAKATPVIIGFDATASMGYLAKELATSSLHNTITSLLSHRDISDPQILCAAIGDCKSDRYPLQVTQFEADIRIIRQLLDLHLEGGGGSNGGESYNLLWYFAARHTSHHHYEKRQKKGFLFTIGDDFCHSSLSAAELSRNFPSMAVQSISNEELLAELRKTYHIFHIHLEKGSTIDAEIFHWWNQQIPGCCAPLHVKDVAFLPGLITVLVSMAEGKTADAALKQIDQDVAERIARSVAAVHIPKETTIISF